MEIRGRQKKYLRGLAHDLNAIVLIGQKGLTDAVVEQIDTALDDHELIKVKLSSEAPIDRIELAEVIAERARCIVAGQIGRVLILYRQHPERPTITLPE